MTGERYVELAGDNFVFSHVQVDPFDFSSKNSAKLLSFIESMQSEFNIAFFAAQQQRSRRFNLFPLLSRAGRDPSLRRIVR